MTETTTTHLIAIEGPDGAGKSKVIRGVLDELFILGVGAVSWAHNRSPHRDPWQASLHYASQRAMLVGAMRNDTVPAKVMLLDRWWLSNYCSCESAARLLSIVERQQLPRLSAVVWLDANDQTLDQRLADRGEAIRPIDREIRASYRSAAEHLDGSAWWDHSRRFVTDACDAETTAGAVSRWLATFMGAR